MNTTNALFRLIAIFAVCLSIGIGLGQVADNGWLAGGVAGACYFVLTMLSDIVEGAG